jgi:hypothetical protein
MGEPWWEMFYEHWFIEVLLFGKHEPQRALDHAIRAVLETSKPQFDHFPQRVSLQMNLAAAYMGIDAIGYETELRAVFSHIKSLCADCAEQQVYYLQLWGYFLELIEDEGAIDAALEYLAGAEDEGSDHYIWDALSMLCTALVRFDEAAARSQLRELAMAGEEIARREGRSRGVCTFEMWQALGARFEGDEAQAKRQYRRAMTLQKRLTKPQNSALFGAMKFHEAGGELERALQICQADIRILQAHRLTFVVAQRRLEKCQLLKQMGRDFDKDAKRLRRVAAGMKSKSHWEARLAELEAEGV